MAPRISVIVRARNEAASIGRCLELVRGQDVEAEMIVVDNESTDGTDGIAAAAGARVLTMPREHFSFGGALNLGAAAASGEILVALSAHAFPLDTGWLGRMAAAFDDPLVACACGERWSPDGSRLTGAVRFDGALAARYPEWGYSNAAGGFRASLWRERPFREDLPACEDREWGRFWTLQGRVCVLDPALLVEHDHTHDPVRSIYARSRRETLGMRAVLGDGAVKGAGSGRFSEAAGEWWTDTRFYENPWRARLSPRRLARIAGALAGGRLRVEKAANT